MKAISKKLLSLLVVMAMVLSMVPFGGLGIFAVETKAAATAAADEIVAAGNAIAATANAMTFTGGEDTQTCPVCNEEVTWTPVKNGESVGTYKTGHFYLAEDVTYTEDAYFATANDAEALCLHLNGKDLVTKFGIRAQRPNSTVNIMGNGNVSSTGGDTDTTIMDATLKASADNSKLNVYGGTYTTGEGSVIYMRRKSVVSIYGTTIIDGNDAYRGVRAVAGTLNINGGTIRNGIPGGHGGNIRAAATDTNGAAVSVVINGGTITDGGDSEKQGGNIYIAGASGKKAVLTINGGTIENGSAGAGLGAEIRVNTYADVIINGGTINGEVSYANATATAATASTLTVSGAPVITGNGLRLPAGLLVTDNVLTTGASITIYQNDQVFATYDDATAAEAAKDYFKAADSDYEVVVDGTSLKLAEKPAVEDDGVFDPAENNGQEFCPVCGTLETWIAVEGDKRVANAGTGHYYLSGDVNYTSTTAEMFASVAEGGKLCIHLNGHNVVSVPGIIANTANSTLNIMGTGTIKSDADPVISCVNATAVINIEAGVVVDGDNAAHRAIRVNPGTVNLNGCTIQNGKAVANGCNINVYGGGTLVINEGTLITGGGDGTKQGGNIYVGGTGTKTRSTLIINGGTIENGQASAETGDEIRVNTYADVIINGGTISGEVSYANATAIAETASTLTMSGAPVITGIGLRLPDGVLVTDAGLTTGASVAVYNAEQVFATYNDAAAAEAAKDYFTSARDDYEIVAQSSSLMLVERVTVPNDGNFDPAEHEGQEWCPVCGTLETWISVEGDKRVANAGTGHYYLSGDVNYTSTTAEMFASVAEGGKLCIHLNGHNVVSVPGIIANTANSTLNIMGDGTIKSDANPVIKCANKTAVINIEAGVAVDGDNANHRVIDVNPGTVNLNGCTIQNGKYTDGQGGNIRVNGGGTLVVNEGTLITGGGDGTKQGGNIYVLGTSATNRGTLIINGGTIENGQASAEAGDEIRVNTHADVIINGGTINGEVSYANATATAETASTLTMSGAPVITGIGLRLPDGVLVTDAGLTTGASVAVYNAEQVFATYDDAAAAEAAKDYFTSARSAYGVGINDCSLYLSCYAVANADDGSIIWCALNEALNQVNGATTKYLKAGADVELNGETVYIDPLRSINVTGTGTVYGIDPDNKDFETSTGRITVDGPVLKDDATFDGTLYIKIADGSFHAIEMGVASVALRPTAMGLYYKGIYKCDAKLAEVITAYGVVLSVRDMPGENFVEEATDHFTVYEAFKEKYDAAIHAVSATSGSVFGIMKEGENDNQERGEMKIYANAYIEVNGEEIYVGDTDNAGKGYYVKDADGNDTAEVNAEFDGVALSLFDVMDMVDKQWDSLNLTETNIEQINTLYDRCKEFGVNWTFNNITGTNA